MELDQKVRVRKTVIVRVRAKALVKEQRLVGKKESKKHPKSKLSCD